MFILLKLKYKNKYIYNYKKSRQRFKVNKGARGAEALV